MRIFIFSFFTVVWSFFILSSSAFATTTSLTEANVKTIDDLLEKQGRIVDSCHEVAIALKSETNSFGQSGTFVHVHYVNPLGKTMDFSEEVSSTAEFVTSRYRDGLYTSIYSSDASIQPSSTYFRLRDESGPVDGLSVLWDAHNGNLHWGWNLCSKSFYWP